MRTEAETRVRWPQPRDMGSHQSREGQGGPCPGSFRRELGPAGTLISDSCLQRMNFWVFKSISGIRSAAPGQTQGSSLSHLLSPGTLARGWIWVVGRPGDPHSDLQLWVADRTRLPSLNPGAPFKPHPVSSGLLGLRDEPSGCGDFCVATWLKVSPMAMPSPPPP